MIDGNAALFKAIEEFKPIEEFKAVEASSEVELYEFGSRCTVIEQLLNWRMHIFTITPTC